MAYLMPNSLERKLIINFTSRCLQKLSGIGKGKRKLKEKSASI